MRTGVGAGPSPELTKMLNHKRTWRLCGVPVGADQNPSSYIFSFKSQSIRAQSQGSSFSAYSHFSMATIVTNANVNAQMIVDFKLATFHQPSSESPQTQSAL